MPYLSFDVDADYTELIRLQQEIAKTKSQLQNFRPGQAGASIDALNKKLAESTARYRHYNHLGLTPANGISPIFLIFPKV